jgi:hypothetical protein
VRPPLGNPGGQRVAAYEPVHAHGGKGRHLG